ncbi:MAG: hypothetical protein HKN67_06530 [Saprospiraceae bacterium]|nr:hypothetical protein [Saprospiraceae bacterium]
MCTGILACSHSGTQSPVAENSIEIKYDSIKAANYGADQYGMKKYVMAFLKKGPNRDLDSIKAAELQMAHLENIGKMAEAGKLVLAGPFLDDGALRGIYIFNVSSLEEAETLTNTDPAVQAGSLTLELREWYGSAGLLEVNKVHKTLSKQSITE